MSETVLRNARRKQRWIIIAFFFFSGILAATWTSRIPDIQQKLALNNAALGTVLFTIPVGLIAGLSVASWLVATFGAKKIMVGSCVCCALALAAAGFSATRFLLMPALFFFGASRTVLNLSSNAGAIDVQQFYDRPIISGFHGIWSGACFLAAGLSTGLILLNVKPAFQFLSVAVILSSVALLFYRRDLNNNLSNEKRPFFVKPDAYLFLLGLMALCSMLAEGAMFDWSVNYFDKVIKAEKTFRTTGYLSFVITMAFGRLVGDSLVHRFGIYRMLIINGAMMAIGFLFVAAFPFVLPAAFGCLLVGAGDSILVPVVYLLAARSKKMTPNYAISSVTLIGYTGFLIGPLLIGNVSQRVGMGTAFYILSIVSVFIIFLTMRVKKMG